MIGHFVIPGREAREPFPDHSTHFIHSRVFPEKEVMLDAAFALAAEISSKSPVAVQGTKINLLYSRDHSVADSLNYAVRLSARPITALL